MRYVAAYLLAALGGNASPSESDIKEILSRYVTIAKVLDVISREYCLGDVISRDYCLGTRCELQCHV